MIPGQRVRVTSPYLRPAWIGTVHQIDGGYVWVGCGAVMASVPLEWCEAIAPNTVNVGGEWSPGQHARAA